MGSSELPLAFIVAFLAFLTRDLFVQRLYLFQSDCNLICELDASRNVSPKGCTSHMIT